MPFILFLVALQGVPVRTCGTVAIVSNYTDAQGDYRVLGVSGGDFTALVLRDAALRASPSPSALIRKYVCGVGAGTVDGLLVTDAAGLEVRDAQPYSDDEVAALIRLARRYVDKGDVPLPEIDARRFSRTQATLFLAATETTGVAKPRREGSDWSDPALHESLRNLGAAIGGLIGGGGVDNSAWSGGSFSAPSSRNAGRRYVNAVAKGVVTLDDGSVWRLDAQDVALWMANDRVTVVDINGSRSVLVDRQGRQVRAERVR